MRTVRLQSDAEAQRVRLADGLLHAAVAGRLARQHHREVVVARVPRGGQGDEVGAESSDLAQRLSR